MEPGGAVIVTVTGDAGLSQDGSLTARVTHGKTDVQLGMLIGWWNGLSNSK